MTDEQKTDEASTIEESTDAAEETEAAGHPEDQQSEEPAPAQQTGRRDRPSSGASQSR